MISGFWNEDKVDKSDFSQISLNSASKPVGMSIYELREKNEHR